MWGVKAVFFAAVLVCLIGSSFADCGNGRMGYDQCICDSSYGPSGSTCSQLARAASAQCVGAVTALAIEASHFPALAIGTQAAPATTFKNNVLHASIEGEYVIGRQYTSLKFTPLANHNVDNRCNLGTQYTPATPTTGGFWQQTPHDDGSSCNDTFELNLPWSEHVACGFGNDTSARGSNSDYLVLTGFLSISYTDAIGEIDNFTLHRTTKVPYSISVKFQKHVTVQLQALNVSSNVKFGMALTEDVYDPISGILTLELTTIINWPNMFYLAADFTKLFYPSQVELQTVNRDTGVLCSDNATLCDKDNAGDQLKATGFWATDDAYDGCSTEIEDSICKQIFLFRAKAPSNCTFDGDYHLQVFLYTCRGTGSKNTPTCTNVAKNITWTIKDSNICGEIGVVPSVGGQLIAFPDTVSSGFRAAHLAKKNTQNFQLGHFGHFFAEIDSDNNIISLNFTEIKFYPSGNSTQVTTLYNKVSHPTVSKYLTIYDQSKFFRIEFHSSIFRVDPNSQITYTFSATADIAFQGNDGFVTPLEDNTVKKRTVEYTWTQASAEASTTAFIRNTGAAPKAAAPVAAQQPAAGVNSVTFIASVVGAVAGTMIIVFVVVGFALRTRSSKDEPHASLLAASAAASEVANRA